MTNISSGALPAVQWRSRPGASGLRASFPGTGLPAVVRQVPRIRNKAALTVPAGQLGQTNNYNHMTSADAVGVGASGPPLRGQPT